MASQWYIYKDQQRKGPYSWAQLYQESRSGMLTAGDLVWNETMKDWERAENIPGLIKKPGAPAAAPPPPAGQKQAKPQTKPAGHPPKSRGSSDYKKLAIAGGAVFIFIISGVVTFLLMNGDDPQETTGDLEDVPVVEEEPEEEGLGLDEMFEDLEEDEEEPLPDDEDSDTETAEQETQQEEEAVEESSTETAQEDTTPVEDTEETEETAEETDPGSDSVAFEGGTYTGPLKDGQPHGQGSWVHPDGRSYTGEFNEGSIEGYGTYTFPGGEQYVGYLRNGRAHGEGTMTHPDGRRVSGIWIHGNLQED